MAMHHVGDDAAKDGLLVVAAALLIGHGPDRALDARQQAHRHERRDRR